MNELSTILKTSTNCKLAMVLEVFNENIQSMWCLRVRIVHKGLANQSKECYTAGGLVGEWSQKAGRRI